MRNNEDRLEQRDWNIYCAVVAALAIIAITTALLASLSVPTGVLIWVK